ncbi:MAG: OmpA family protein [Myxococcaceae bacterium]|nr:OmpA family protein [Myxococcaceae bacterium]
MTTTRLGNLSRPAGLLLFLAAAAASAADATAPGFSLTRFEPAGRGSRFFTLESLDWRGNQAPILGFVADYAHKPLVIYRVNATGEQEVITVAREMLVGTLGGSFSFANNFRVGADLPVVMYAEGTSGQVGLTEYVRPQRSGIGDLRLSGDWRFYGSANDALRAGLGLRLYLPTGDAGAYAGNRAVRGTLTAQVAGELARVIAWSARLGVELSSREISYASGNIGNGAHAGLAIAWRGLGGRLNVGPEVAASTSFSNAFTRSNTSLEVLLGAHYDITPSWRVGLGIGRGTTPALGSPAVRGLLTVEWSPSTEAADACRDQLAADAAARQREQGERLAAERRAAAAAAALAAREKAEAERQLAERLAAERDAADAAAKAAAYATADDDGDGIMNSEDACPGEAGPHHAERSKRGCPTGAVVGDQLVLDVVRFQTGSDVILAESNATLEKVFAALQKLPAGYTYRVEGHTDDRGPAAFNKDLSVRRAKSVIAWLVARGFDAKRLSPAGFGAEQPLAANDSDLNRQSNRRVEFHITNLEVKP